MSAAVKSAADLLNEAEEAGLVVIPWSDGTMSIIGSQDSDEALMREVVRRGKEIAAEIDRRTPSNQELCKLKRVRRRHRPDRPTG
jgi:phosphosulfolactate synthase (CoM biosynthesis protein A)